MGAFSLWHWLIVVLVLALIFVLPLVRKPTRIPANSRDQPVFSSVAVTGREAEHIDERLPKKLWRVLLTLFTVSAIGTFIWWHS